MIRSFVLLTLILFGLSLFAQTTVTVRIDADNARGGTATEVFDSIRFIPLETTKESLFGTINQMEVTDSLFIILDINSNSILLFRRNGKFYTKIFTGGGTKYFYSFTLDRSANEIIARNNYTDGLLVYDLHGKFLRKEVIPSEVMTLFHLPGNTVLYAFYRKRKVESPDHMVFDLGYSKGYNQVFKNILPGDARNDDVQTATPGTTFNFSGEEGSCMFTRPYEYNIYQLNDTGLLRKYQLIFPLRYSLPLNFFTDVGYSHKRSKYAFSSPGTASTVLSLDRCYRYGGYLLFSAFTRQLYDGADYTFAYNLHSGSLLSFSRVTGDSSSYYFPILSGLFEKIDAIYKDTIFSSMPGFRLFAFKNGLDKQVNYPEGLREYFANGRKGDNCVIMQFRLKPNL